MQIQNLLKYILNIFFNINLNILKLEKVFFKRYFYFRFVILEVSFEMIFKKRIFKKYCRCKFKMFKRK